MWKNDRTWDLACLLEFYGNAIFNFEVTRQMRTVAPCEKVAFIQTRCHVTFYVNTIQKNYLMRQIRSGLSRRLMLSWQFYVALNGNALSIFSWINSMSRRTKQQKYWISWDHQMRDILKATSNRQQLASTTSNPRTLTPSSSCQLQLPLRIANYYGHNFHFIQNSPISSSS